MYIYIFTNTFTANVKYMRDHNYLDAGSVVLAVVGPGILSYVLGERERVYSLARLFSANESVDEFFTK